MTSLNFIFTGRLNKEKGVPLLIDIIKYSINNNLGHNFYIFGAGPLSKNLLQAFPSSNLLDFSKKSDNFIKKFNPIKNQIIFTGFRDLNNVISPILKTKINYSIIPSKFLETFGYSALEAISHGVPVLSSGVGGLEQFTLKKHRFAHNLDSFTQIVHKLKKVSTEEKQFLKDLSQQYSQFSWLKSFQKITSLKTKKKTKILLVSDFSEPIGGTEKHLQDLQQIFTESKNYQVKTFTGTKFPSKLNLVKAVSNKKAATLLQKEITEFKPDIIWTHSISRFLGVKTLKIINNSTAKKFHTIHDLGLFTSKPSLLESPSKTSKNFLKYYLLQKPILQELKQFQYIIIPSKFFKPMLPPPLKKKTFLLPHFQKQND